MMPNLLKPCGFCALILSLTYRFTLGDVAAQTGTQLFLNRFSDDVENQFAVCNDGTKGGYYYSPASLAEANDTFIIHLPGGGQCYDEDSCNERWKFKPSSMSSTNFPASKFKKGFMDNSMKKTPFWSANKVMLGYCSSDGYMGDVAASADTWGWHFRGQQLVFSMIRDLILNHKLSSTSTIVFSGGSAGARGVMVLIDMLVANYFPKGAKVVGFLDSPYYIDVPSFSPLYKGFQYEESMKYKHMNTKNIISPECAANYPDVKEQWKCQFGQYRMPFVKTSYFLISSQYDSYQLQMDTQTVPPYGKSATDYVSQFGSTIHNNLVFLRDMKLKETAKEASSDSIYAFYSWTCYNHDVSASSDFYTMAVDEGVTQKDALEAFLKASVVAYSSTRGVISSDSIRSGVSVLNVPSQKSKAKKDKLVVNEVKKLPQVADGIQVVNDKSILGNSLMNDNKNTKQHVQRLSTVHSWVDSCSGMNCGTSCPAASPITKPAPSSAANRDRNVANDHYEIASMAGTGISGISSSQRSAKMLSQYNAESDSEEDNDDEKPLFIPIAASPAPSWKGIKDDMSTLLPLADVDTTSLSLVVSKDETITPSNEEGRSPIHIHIEIPISTLSVIENLKEEEEISEELMDTVAIFIIPSSSNSTPFLPILDTLQPPASLPLPVPMSYALSLLYSPSPLTLP